MTSHVGFFSISFMCAQVQPIYQSFVSLAAILETLFTTFEGWNSEEKVRRGVGSAGDTAVTGATILCHSNTTHSDNLGIEKLDMPVRHRDTPPALTHRMPSGVES